MLHLAAVDGSLETLLGAQLRAFQQAGWTVVTASAPGPHVELLERDGIRHHPLKNATRSWSLRKDLKAFWEVFRLFRAIRPDVVHTHTPKPGVYGRVAAWAAGVPIIVNTVHGLYAQPEDRRLKRWACWGSELVASWCSDAELVQNSEDLATLKRVGVSAKKLTLFGNGVDLHRFTAGDGSGRRRAREEFGADDSDVVVGCVARLTEEKGLVELLDGFEIARRQVPNLRLVLVGPPDRFRQSGAEQILERAGEVGAICLGTRDDVVDLYEGMDMFVLPSHREGFPRSVMEASAMGLPIIGTDIRGMREAVEPGVTGFLIPVRDPAEISKAMVELALDPDRRAAMGRAAREMAERCFDFNRQVQMSLEVYRRAER